MTSRMILFGSLFLMALATASNANASRSVAVTPQGTCVETTDGVYTTITLQELRSLLANKHCPLINVRIPYEVESEGTDAVLPYDEIDKIVDRLSSHNNAVVVVYCRSGPMSQKTSEALVKVERLSAALEIEDVVLGGGNVKKLKKLPPGSRRRDNGQAFIGGFKPWANLDGERRPLGKTRPS